MHSVLLTIQNSSFAFWLSQGAYPIILTIHSVGLALLVGLLFVIDLRVLGLGRGMPVASLRRFMKVVWLGFWANAISGTLLFCISPLKFLDSTTFRFKLSFIFVGLVIAWVLNSSLLKVGDEYAPISNPTVRQRALAALSIACWVSAIVAGRLLAYTTFADIGIGE